MELCEQTLETLLHEKDFSETEAIDLTKQMCHALHFIHQHGLVHLDVKPQNIFVKADIFKLGDFGLVSSANTGDEVTEGDSRYMSRELLRLESPSDLTKCDIFSLGCTIFQVCTKCILTENGDLWVDLREDRVPQISLSPPLSSIVHWMMRVLFFLHESAFQIFRLFRKIDLQPTASLAWICSSLRLKGLSKMKGRKIKSCELHWRQQMLVPGSFVGQTPGRSRLVQACPGLSNTTPTGS